jgi:hypothetical protein
LSTTVSISDIRSISKSELNERRLSDLQNGFSSFEEVLNSKSDPIVLDSSSKPYDIIDGRHRVYLARDKGYSSITAILQ